MPTAPDVLHRVFGYSAFRGDQAAIIEQVVSGGDAVVLMPTGGGKSLCYQIPALVRPGTGVVISPLIALMQDQVDALEALGVECVRYEGADHGFVHDPARPAHRAEYAADAWARSDELLRG